MSLLLRLLLIIILVPARYKYEQRCGFYTRHASQSVDQYNSTYHVIQLLKPAGKRATSSRRQSPNETKTLEKRSKNTAAAAPVVNVSEFLRELVVVLPGTVNAHASVLLLHLSSRPHQIRLAVVVSLAEIVAAAHEDRTASEEGERGAAAAAAAAGGSGGEDESQVGGERPGDFECAGARHRSCGSDVCFSEEAGAAASLLKQRGPTPLVATWVEARESQLGLYPKECPEMGRGVRREPALKAGRLPLSKLWALWSPPYFMMGMQHKRQAPVGTPPPPPPRALHLTCPRATLCACCSTLLPHANSGGGGREQAQADPRRVRMTDRNRDALLDQLVERALDVSPFVR